QLLHSQEVITKKPRCYLVVINSIAYPIPGNSAELPFFPPHQGSAERSAPSAETGDFASFSLLLAANCISFWLGFDSSTPSFQTSYTIGRCCPGVWYGVCFEKGLTSRSQNKD